MFINRSVVHRLAYCPVMHVYRLGVQTLEELYARVNFTPSLHSLSSVGVRTLPPKQPRASGFWSSVRMNRMLGLLDEAARETAGATKTAAPTTSASVMNVNRSFMS
jgi:hypothetical protein